MMVEKLNMLRIRTLTFAKPHTMFENPVHMNNGHLPISKYAVILRAFSPEIRCPSLKMYPKSQKEISSKEPFFHC